MKKGIRIGTVFFLIVATAFVTAIGTYFYLSKKVSNLSKNEQLYSKLDIVSQVIDRNYVNPIDPVDGVSSIEDGMIAGYIEGLNDPHSYYLNEKNYKTAVILDASSISIGILYDYDPSTGGIMINYCERNSPAYKAGIKDGDIIVAINGINVSEDGYKRAAQRLLGAEGSEISLSIVRDGESSILSFDLIRNEFIPETVSYKMVENGIGYVTIYEFTNNTLSDFNFAYDDLTSKGMKGLIIDVRNTFAGELDYVVNLADRIMSSGIIVAIKDKLSSSDDLRFATEDKIDIPMVILQNGNTSGIAEVFCAALRDNDVAQTVGDTTKGYALGQKDIPLSDGTAIHLSVYEYVAPSGERYNKNGLVPNYYSTLTEDKQKQFETLTDEEDDQLQYAIYIIKDKLGL